MWFPTDKGMINLERVAFIEVDDSLEVSFYNDHRAKLTQATFESEKQLRQYLEKLKGELTYPVSNGDQERFPASEREPLLEPGVVEGGDASGE